MRTGLVHAALVIVSIWLSFTAVAALLFAAAAFAVRLRLRGRRAEATPAAHTQDVGELLASHARVERSLWEATLLQEAIVESANYIVISTDRRGIIRTFNRAATAWLGYRPLEVVGLVNLDVLHDRDEIGQRAAALSNQLGRPIDAGFEALATRARAGGADEAEWTYVRRDGTRFPALLSITALRIPDGDITGFLVVASDLTERKRAQALAEAYLGEVEAARDRIAVQARILESQTREIERTRDQALEATRAKSAFLATISHEIRTPMNGIIGLSTMLLDTPLAEDQRDVAQTILQSADSLLTIINDVLDFSKIEAGKLTLEQSEMDLRQIVEDAMRLMGASARDKALSLVANVDAQLPARLVGDSSRLRQVLLNLVGNAVKFTSRGAVTVNVACRQRGDRGIDVDVSVVDTGIGIASDVQPRLFQAFTQADASTTRRYGGTGLGLAICRQIIELMGGTIGVESAPDRGSRFWFTVPLERATPATASVPAATAAPAPPAERPGARLSILLVEDNAVNRKVATRMLEKLGHTVATAHNGIEAVEAVAVGNYDAILMDCQMPELDGYGAAARIRASETSRRVPIVAVTANAAGDDRARCLAAGMDDYLSKPLRIADLSDALDRWTKHTRGA